MRVCQYFSASECRQDVGPERVPAAFPVKLQGKDTTWEGKAQCLGTGTDMDGQDGKDTVALVNLCAKTIRRKVVKWER